MVEGEEMVMEPRERGGDERHSEGSVVVAIVGVGGHIVGVVAHVGVAGEIFCFRPIERELGEFVLRGGRQGGADGWGEFLEGEVAEAGEGAGLVGIVVDDDLGCVGRVVDKKGAGNGLDAVGGAEKDVVLHVLPDAGKGRDDWDVILIQGFQGPNAREHEELGRLERAR